jgi:preprotein translocase subunit SecB
MNDTPPNKSAGNGANGHGPAAAEPAQRTFALQQLYLKDLSFEAPNSPQVFAQGGIEPETELNIRNAHQVLDAERYEVVLHIRIHAQQTNNTIFLIELEQAGVFQIAGYTPEQITTLLGTQCPATLFPFVRETISSLVGKGGFPPLMLQPINFEGLFARAREQQQQQDAQA